MRRSFLTLIVIALASILVAGPAGGAVPRLKIKGSSVAEGGSAKFTISLTSPSSRKVRVHWATADGDAVAPDDYAASSGTAVIKPGRTKAVVKVPTSQDSLDEASESFDVALSQPRGARIKVGTAAGSISDDDAPPSASIADAGNVTEGNSGTTPATFTVTLSAVSGQEVTVPYATADGSATAPSDFTAMSGALVIQAGDSGGDIVVPIVGDTTEESNESFDVNISASATATVGDASGTATIVNDDCVDDYFENNDAWVSPTILGSVTSSGTTTVNGKRCAGDDDYFQVTATDGDGPGFCITGEDHVVAVTMTYPHAAGDLDLAVRPTDPGGSAGTWSSTGITGTEQVELNFSGGCFTSDSRTFYIRVYGFPAGVINGYSLSVQHSETEY